MIDLRNINPLSTNYYPIDAENVFWTSDTHFGHAAILKYEEGYHNFSTIEERDEMMIQSWNNKVPKDGLVFHIGDFAYGNKKQIRSFVERLNGEIFLILGNHDRQIKKCAHMFHNVAKELYISVRDDDAQKGYQKIVMYHYPQISWNGACHESWCLHGHTHQINYENGRLLNVGMINHNYEILSYNEIKEKLLSKEPKINKAFTSY